MRTMPSAAAALLPAVLLTACGGERAPTGPGEVPAAAGLLVASARRADTLWLRVRLESGVGTGAWQAAVRFDPRAWRFAGQAQDADLLAVAHVDDREGRVGLAVLRRDGRPLGGAAVWLAFEGAAPAGRAPVVDAARVARLDRTERDVTVRLDAPAEPPPSGPARLSLDDWLLRVGEPSALRDVITARPGDGRLYGDATLNQLVSIGDAVATASAAAGNRPLLTDVTLDLAIAANVAPFNLPGLGGADDPVPPGRQPDGTFVITVADALAIAQFVSGTPSDVVGRPIPGRDRATARATLEGVLSESRALSRDTVYELRGAVIVPRDVTLELPPGTRLEGDPATAGRLIVQRGGRLRARGTRLEPVVFTCAGAPAPACWGGVILAGSSLLNNGTTAVGPVDVNGCPEQPNPYAPGSAFGGCLIESGLNEMRYVRIEYAGAMGMPGLGLLGEGTGTLLDSLQVHASGGDGVLVAGGTARFRHLLVSRSAGAGLRWRDGWQGAAQFVIVHQPSGAGPALDGANLAANPAAAPRSRPDLANLTLLASDAAVVGRHGTELRLRNSAVDAGAAPAIELADAPTCDRLAAVGTITLAGLVLETSAEAAGTACPALASFLADPARGNRALPLQLVAGRFTASPDYRPALGSPLVTGAEALQPNLFFDVTASFIGAVGPANSTGTNVPWYAGWTVGW